MKPIPYEQTQEKADLVEDLGVDEDLHSLKLRADWRVSQKVEINTSIENSWTRATITEIDQHFNATLKIEGSQIPVITPMFIKNTGLEISSNEVGPFLLSSFVWGLHCV